MSELSTDQKFLFFSASFTKCLSLHPLHPNGWELSLQECVDQQDVPRATERINKVTQIILTKQKNMDVIL